ncbi:hypothetical protein GNY91_09805 [Glaesserella parasuis]|uniref:hypothetical protein n=1 Tax=Glaesserella parasuis TaxID=738 RepID=UPI001323C345|nr:hypothetical protein [Glaesserella parasuis]MDG6247740.1 hypothetical protein [Glaesserella parasuis]MXP17612.1 hypothetical protein [Glaesserella parasuis]
MKKLICLGISAFLLSACNEPSFLEKSHYKMTLKEIAELEDRDDEYDIESLEKEVSKDIPKQEMKAIFKKALTKYPEMQDCSNKDAPVCKKTLAEIIKEFR